MKFFIVFAVLIGVTSAAPQAGNKCDCRQVSYDLKLLYDARNCTAIKNPDCPMCIVRYECPEIKDSSQETGCNYFGKSYAVGQEVKSENNCQHCQCQNDKKVQCVGIECPSLFGVPPYPEEYANVNVSQRPPDWEAKTKNCFWKPVPGQCCPVSSCPSDAELQKMKNCNYQNRTILNGQSFEIQSKCLNCICSSDFDESQAEKNPLCKPIACGYDNERIKQGCAPVFYRADTCCPITYACPKPNRAKRVELCKSKPEPGFCYAAMQRYYYNETNKKCEIFTYGGCGGNANNFKTEQECESFCVKDDDKPQLYTPSSNQCFFDGVNYSIGSTMSPKIANESPIDCTCITPPTLTCIQRKVVPEQTIPPAGATNSTST